MRNTFFYTMWRSSLQLELGVSVRTPYVVARKVFFFFSSLPPLPLLLLLLFLLLFPRGDASLGSDVACTSQTSEFPTGGRTYGLGWLDRWLALALAGAVPTTHTVTAAVGYAFLTLDREHQPHLKEGRMEGRREGGRKPKRLTDAATGE
jgi:hypothetical protein